MISPSVFGRPTTKFGLECSLPCTTVLYFMMIESNPVKKNKGHLESPALVPEISPLTVERCHSKPTLVRESLFNLYHWTAEEHHAARPSYLSKAALSHTPPAPADICLFPLVCHGNCPNFTHTNTLLAKRWSAHDSDTALTQDHVLLLYMWADHGWVTWKSRNHKEKYLWASEGKGHIFSCFSLGGDKWF